MSGDANPAPADPGPAPGRAAHWQRLLPWLVAACGAAYLALLLSLAHPGVFFSGDGGLKSLLVEQFARGDLAPDLRLPAEPWVEALWREGFYPFDHPFTHVVDGKVFLWCPLPFEYLTAPAYARMGWRGLYFWPAVSVLAVWLTAWRLCRRLDLHPAATAIALFAIVFCSPLTLYGAMFWEHAPGVALAFGGLALLAAPALRDPTLNALLAGGLLGLSVWFRGELAWLAALAATLVLLSRPLGLRLAGRGAFLAGLALAGIGFLAWNAALYGAPLGITSKHFAFGNEATPLSTWSSFLELMSLLAVTGPALALALVGGATVALLRPGAEPTRASVRFWGLLALAFALGVVLVLPRAVGGGGLQFGPRYELVVYPLAAIVLALSVEPLWARVRGGARAALAATLAVGLGAGAWVNSGWGGAAVAQSYGPRMVPVLEAVRDHPAQVVVVTSQDVAQGLTPFFETRRFFLAKSPEDLVRLAFSLAETGRPVFTVASFVPFDGFERGVVAGQPASLTVNSTGCHGSVPICTARATVRTEGR